MSNRLICHCQMCETQWVVGWLPMPMENAAQRMMEARCPFKCEAPVMYGTARTEGELPSRLPPAITEKRT